MKETLIVILLFAVTIVAAVVLGIMATKEDAPPPSGIFQCGTTPDANGKPMLCRWDEARETIIPLSSGK